MRVAPPHPLASTWPASNSISARARLLHMATGPLWARPRAVQLTNERAPSGPRRHRQPGAAPDPLGRPPLGPLRVAANCPTLSGKWSEGRIGARAAHASAPMRPRKFVSFLTISPSAAIIVIAPRAASFRPARLWINISSAGIFD